MKIIALLLSSFVALPISTLSNLPVKKAFDTKGTIYYDLSETEVKNYYNSINNSTGGDAGLDKLQTLLKQNQVKVNYTSGSSKKSTAWYGYYLYERDYNLSPLEDTEKDGNYKTSGIWIQSLYVPYPIYIEAQINKGNFKYKDSKGIEHTGTFQNSKVQFDREHVFPKSYGFNGAGDQYQNLTVGCDAHNLHIGEHFGNSAGHNNYPYGNVLESEKIDTNAIKDGLTSTIIGYLGKNKNGDKVFEPTLLKDKGDIARSIFYMCARYHTYEQSNISSENDISPALTLVDSDPGFGGKTIEPSETKDNPAKYGVLSDLLERNKLDPVDQFEVHRNNLVYNSVNGNRNPFVDYPNWADYCYGDKKSETLSTDSPKLISNTSSETPQSESTSPSTNTDTKDDTSTNQVEESPIMKFIKSVPMWAWIVAGVVVLALIIAILILAGSKGRKKVAKQAIKYANKVTKNKTKKRK